MERAYPEIESNVWGINLSEVLIGNKSQKEELKEKGIIFSDTQLKFTKKLKDGLIVQIALEGNVI